MSLVAARDKPRYSRAGGLAPVSGLTLVIFGHSGCVEDGGNMNRLTL